ncbi:MAG: toll/interleukin-1 receptor domain-containing protein [Planctomycetota bacterium]
MPSAKRVFVSYAHVDDAPLGGGDGWVSSVIKSMIVMLGRQLGRKDAFNLVWIDPQLRGNDRVPDRLREELESAWAFVAFVSPAYLESEWCLGECAEFQQQLPSGASRYERVFVVEMSPSSRDRWPALLADQRGYEFWYRELLSMRARTRGVPAVHDEDLDYWHMLEDLSQDLACCLRGSVPPAPYPSPVPSVSDVRVFLAEVPSSLQAAHREVARCLRQAGIIVVPSHDSAVYPEDEVALHSQVSRDIATCALFVHLLGEDSMATDRERGRARIQVRCAQDSQTPIMQWREPHARASDQQTAEMLFGDKVRAEPLARFKEEVKVHATQLAHVPPPNRPTPETAFFRISAEQADLPVVDQIIGKLRKSEIAFDAVDGVDLESSFRYWDGFLVVFGRAEAKWVAGNLRICRKMAARGPQPPTVLGLYDGPPIEKEPLRYHSPEILWIDARESLNHAALDRFVELVKRRALDRGPRTWSA